MEEKLQETTHSTADLSEEDIMEGTYLRDMPKGCKLIVTPKACDARGELCFMEGNGHIPFPIARVFFLYNIPEGATRGDHSHNTCVEVVFPVHGEFTMTVDNGKKRASIRMTKPHIGILIPPGVWCKLTDFEKGTVCAVVASHKYDASGYTLSYEEYIKGINP